MRSNKNNYLNKDTESRQYHNISDLKVMFSAADSLFPIDTKRKSRTLETLRQEIADKEVLLISDKRKIWLNQMRYADRSLLGVHILGCIVVLLLIVIMDMRHVDSESVIAYTMILAGLLGSLSVLQIGRVCFAKLAELSETCFFNTKQMTAFHMVLSGIVSLAALFLGVIFVGFRWKIWLLQIGLYLLVPFVLTQCACLGVLLTEAGRKNNWLTAVVGIFLSVFYAILASAPQLYTSSALIVWGIALAAGAAVFGIQVKTFFAEINKGEILCTNWN